MRVHLALLCCLLPTSLASSCYPNGGVTKDDTDWTPVDTEGDTDADTDADTDTDTTDTGTPWDERDWPSTQEMFIGFAYPASQEQLAVEMGLNIMGASQLDSNTWTVTNSGTTWTIHFERAGDNMAEGLRTPGAVVIYAGHSNYGLGGVYSDLPDLSQIEEIETVQDFFNFGTPHAGINYSYLTQDQAYPNLTIRPEDIAEDPVNYEVPIIGGDRFPNDDGVGIGDTFPLRGSGSSAYHYTNGGNRYLIVNAGADDIPGPSELAYDVLFLKSCNSGRYYIENFQHGDVFYTIDNVYADEMVVTVDLFVKHIILRTPYWEIAELMDEREGNPVYEWMKID
jgi:hypothetical protein